MTTLRERYDSRWGEAEKRGKFDVEVGKYRFEKGGPRKGKSKEEVYLVDLEEFMRIPMPELGWLFARSYLL